MLTRPLRAKTVSDLLVYLESRPLGEVFALFTDIISQLSVKDGDGSVSNSDGLGAALTGSGNPNGGDHSVSTLPTEQGGGGAENRVENIHRGDFKVPPEG